MEVLGIGLIVPFISLLSHPDLIEKNIYLKQAYHLFPFHSFLQFMVVFAVCIIIAYILKSPSC